MEGEPQSVPWERTSRTTQVMNSWTMDMPPRERVNPDRKNKADQSDYGHGSRSGGKFATKLEKTIGRDNEVRLYTEGKKGQNGAKKSHAGTSDWSALKKRKPGANRRQVRTTLEEGKTKPYDQGTEM